MRSTRRPRRAGSTSFPISRSPFHSPSFPPCSACPIRTGPLALLRPPDQRQRLGDPPALESAGTEDFPRLAPPVQQTRRITLADVTVGTKTIPKGAFVMCSLASANRDTAHFGPTAGDL